MRRVVLEHTVGPLAGLRQILGAVWPEPLPEAIGDFTAFERVVVYASLTKKTQTMALYSEAKEG